MTVIGYSAGGVVAWLWDVDYGGVRKAQQIITLGSPLHGADLAALGQAFVPSACPAACQELVPGSAMLSRLQQTASATRPPWLSLWTTDDQVVQPSDSARLPGADPAWSHPSRRSANRCAPSAVNASIIMSLTLSTHPFESNCSREMH